jgi:signal transduction histidine kinase
MVMTDMLDNALNWTFRQMQQYKTKEQFQAAFNLLQQIIYEAERQRHKEEIKALRLESELQAQRERLGRDLHDGFGSQLTHIISRLDLLACTGAPDPGQLLRLSEFAREMNRTLRETIWLLDHESVTVEAFGARIHSMLLKVWEERELPVLRWQILNTLENPLLSPLIVMQLVRITQEAISNALKYAEATQICVKLKINTNNLILTIKDDGHGFNAKTASMGFGLTNMHKRAEEVKGSFSLHTDHSGTNIDVVLPLNT